VKGHKVNIGDYTIKVGDKITVKGSEKSKKKIKGQLESNPNFTTQSWLQVDSEKPEATVVALPTRDDIQIPVQEQLIVEFCSR
jgi:small subunit ribosomal protein S4